MILFYVRHGDPIYTPDSLTPLGLRQAEAIAKRLATYGIDKLYSSTSNRALLTAQPTSELTKKEIVQLDFCNEGYAWKDFAIPTENGAYKWAFFHKPMIDKFLSREVLNLGDKWYDHKDFANYNFKNGVNRVNKHVDEFLLSLGYEHDRENSCYKPVKPNKDRVALFAHQGFGLSFLSSVLDIPYPIIATKFDISWTGLTVIYFNEKDDNSTIVPQILTLSNDSHLYKEGLPTNYNDKVTF